MLGDLAHEQLMQITPDTVFQRTSLEPVKLFFLEDLITDKSFRGTVEQRAGVEPEQEIVDTQDYINIILGRPAKSFKTHKARICALSDYIQSAINSRGTPDKVSARPTICLPEEDPISFEIIHTWINNQTFLMPNTDTAYFYTRIIEAFVLAERLLMPEVCNAMLAYLHYTAPAGLLHCHGFIYSNTVLGSPLRSMLLDMLMNESRFGDFCDMSADYGANNSEFLLDLKNQLVEKLRLSRMRGYDSPYPPMNGN